MSKPSFQNRTDSYCYIRVQTAKLLVPNWSAGSFSSAAILNGSPTNNKRLPSKPNSLTSLFNPENTHKSPGGQQNPSSPPSRWRDSSWITQNTSCRASLCFPRFQKCERMATTEGPGRCVDASGEVVSWNRVKENQRTAMIVEYMMWTSSKIILLLPCYKK